MCKRIGIAAALNKLTFGIHCFLKGYLFKMNPYYWIREQPQCQIGRKRTAAYCFFFVIFLFDFK